MDAGQRPTKSDRLRMLAVILRPHVSAGASFGDVIESLERIAWELQAANTVTPEMSPPLDFTLRADNVERWRQS